MEQIAKNGTLWQRNSKDGWETFFWWKRTMLQRKKKFLLAGERGSCQSTWKVSCNSACVFVLLTFCCGRGKQRRKVGKDEGKQLLEVKTEDRKDVWGEDKTDNVKGIKTYPLPLLQAHTSWEKPVVCLVCVWACLCSLRVGFTWLVAVFVACTPPCICSHPSRCFRRGDEQVPFLCFGVFVKRFVVCARISPSSIKAELETSARH